MDFKEDTDEGESTQPSLKDQLVAMGYVEDLIPDAVPLVRRIFRDLVSVTKRLESKIEVSDELEAQLVEVHTQTVPLLKRHNARLIRENNNLHAAMVRKARERGEENSETVLRTRKLEDENSEMKFKIKMKDRMIEDLKAKNESFRDKLRRRKEGERVRVAMASNTEGNLSSMPRPWKAPAPPTEDEDEEEDEEDVETSVGDETLEDLRDRVEELEVKLAQSQRVLEMNERERDRLKSMIEKENAEDIESGSDRAKSRYINEANQRTIEQLTNQIDFLNNQITERDQRYEDLKSVSESKWLQLREAYDNQTKDFAEESKKCEEMDRQFRVLKKRLAASEGIADGLDPVLALVSDTQKAVDDAVQEASKLGDENESLKKNLQNLRGHQERGNLLDALVDQSKQRGQLRVQLQELQNQLEKARRLRRIRTRTRGAKTAQWQTRAAFSVTINRVSKMLASEAEDASKVRAKLATVLKQVEKGENEILELTTSLQIARENVASSEKVITSQKVQIEQLRESLAEQRRLSEEQMSRMEKQQRQHMEEQAKDSAQRRHLDMAETSEKMTSMELELRDAEKRKAELQAEVSMLRRECAEASGFVAVSSSVDASAEDGTTKNKSSLEERAAAKHEHAAMMAKISESRNRDVSDSLRVALKQSMQRSQSSQEASIAAQRHVVELRSQLNSARAESRALSETMEVVRADLKAARADALRKHLAEQSVRAELDAMRDDRVALASRNETSSVKLSESEAVLRRTQDREAELRNELERARHELRIAKSQSESLNRSEDTSKGVLTEQHIQLRAAQGRMSALESSLEEEIARRTSAEKDRTRLQRQLHESEETCRQLRNDLSTTRAQLRNCKEGEIKMKTQLDQMRALFVRLDDTRSQLTEKLQRSRADAERAETEASKARASMTSLEERARRAETKCERLKNSLADLDKQRDAIQVEADRAVEELRNANENASIMKDRAEAQTEECAQTQERLRRASSMLTTREHELGLARQRVSKLEMELKQSTQSATLHEAELRAAQDDMRSITHEVAALNKECMRVREEKKHLETRVRDLSLRLRREGNVRASLEAEKQEMLATYRVMCSERERLGVAADKFGGEVTSLKSSISRRDREVRRLQRTLNQCRENLRSKNEKLRVAEEQLQDQARLLHDARERSVAIQEQSQVMIASANSAKRISKTLVGTQRESQDRVARAELRLEDARREIERLRDSNRVLMSNRDEMDEKIVALERMVASGRRREVALARRFEGGEKDSNNNEDGEDNDSSSSLDSKNSGEYLDRGHVSLQSARKMFEKLSQHAETQDASFEAAMQENQRLREQLRVSIEKTRAANASSLAMSSTTSNSTQQNVMLSDMFDESGDHPLESVLDGEEDGDV